MPLILNFGARRLRVKAIVDTGFNGYISVPRHLLQRSNWTFLGFEQYGIATGQVIRERVFLGKISFDEELHDVYSVASDSKDVLIGTRLLRGKRLLIDFHTKQVIT